MLPPAFVGFMGSDEPRARIRSCNDCYLDLGDFAAPVDVCAICPAVPGAATRLRAAAMLRSPAGGRPCPHSAMRWGQDASLQGQFVQPPPTPLSGLTAAPVLKSVFWLNSVTVMPTRTHAV